MEKFWNELNYPEGKFIRCVPNAQVNGVTTKLKGEKNNFELRTPESNV